jgi:hypothetical protein
MQSSNGQLLLLQARRIRAEVFGVQHTRSRDLFDDDIEIRSLDIYPGRGKVSLAPHHHGFAIRNSEGGSG